MKKNSFVLDYICFIFVLLLFFWLLVGTLDFISIKNKLDKYSNIIKSNKNIAKHIIVSKKSLTLDSDSKKLSELIKIFQNNYVARTSPVYLLFYATQYFDTLYKIDEELISSNSILSISLSHKEDLLKYIKSSVKKEENIAHNLIFSNKILSNLAFTKESDKKSYIDKLDDKYNKMHSIIFYKSLVIASFYKEYISIDNKLTSTIKNLKEIDLINRYIIIYLDVFLPLILLLLVSIIYSIKEFIALNINMFIDRSTGLKNIDMLLYNLKENVYRDLKGVVFLKVMNLKEITDGYGIDIGDKVRKNFVNLLNKKINNIDMYTYGSSSFLFMVNQNRSVDQLILDLKELSYSLTEDDMFHLKINVGVELNHLPKDGNELSIIYRAINALEYLVFSNKIDFSQLYNSSVEAYRKDNRKNITLYKSIQEAIKLGNLTPFYQPIKSLEDNSIHSFESLMRMYDSKGNILLPSEFLSVMEDMNIFHEVTILSLDRAFLNVDKYKVRITVNIFFKDLINDYFLEHINLLLSKYKNFDTSKIVFEVLENDFTNVNGLAIDTLNTIKKLGFKVAIDDFGSGFSNFSNFLLIEPDYIKIDGEFIKDILKDNSSKKVVDTIIMFAKQLGVATIAEFVHSQDIENYLVSKGINFIQGHHVSKEVKDIGDFYKNRSIKS